MYTAFAQFNSTVTWGEIERGVTGFRDMRDMHDQVSRLCVCARAHDCGALGKYHFLCLHHLQRCVSSLSPQVAAALEVTEDVTALSLVQAMDFYDW